MGFGGENFRGLLARTAYCPLNTIAEKTFTDRYKTVKFAKAFSLKGFPLYEHVCISTSVEKPLFRVRKLVC